MKLKRNLLALFLLLTITSFSTNNLRIIDPQQNWWGQYSAAIKSAELEIRPVGGFMENNLSLSIGLVDPYIDNNLQLEIILEFNLPVNSMITDSWLWIEGEPKRADILDRWTASNIYEEIVNRRKDPSLLVKNGANQYAINIYPLKPNETRKFKITYLTPIEYSGNKILCSYPFTILQTSASPVSKLDVYAHQNGTYSKPTIEFGSTEFLSYTDNQIGSCYKAEIPTADFGKAKITFINSNIQPVKVFNYQSGNEGFYQLSFIPSEIFDVRSSSQNTCYLIDYDDNFLTTSKSDLINLLKDNLTGSFTDKDSFNVIFSNLALDQAFDSWEPISQQNLNNAFTNVSLSEYSNLIQLIAKGITFVNNSGGKGKIVLLSNFASFQGVEVSNNILKDINNLNSNNIQIDVINYMDNSYNYYWIGNTYYYGNSYLYSNIARTNSGEYISFYDRIAGSSFSELLTNALSDVSDQALSNIDVYTDLDNGYCFGRIDFSTGSSQSYKMNNPVNQIGKYSGNFPLNVEVSAELNSEIIHQEITVDPSDIITIDSTLKTIWTGFDIFQLESESQSSQVINEIIFESVDNRILSRYTAFLCVEDSITICENCNDNNEDGPIIVNADFLVKKEFKAYPNPFINSIEFSFEETDQLQKIEIYNVMGQKIKEITVEEGRFTYSWNGTDEQQSIVKSGIYLVVARLGNKTISFKIEKS
jgi:Ca-activated chloride channel family protein